MNFLICRASLYLRILEKAKMKSPVDSSNAAGDRGFILSGFSEPYRGLLSSPSPYTSFSLFLTQISQSFIRN
jgi:hypothetical protein